MLIFQWLSRFRNLPLSILDFPLFPGGQALRGGAAWLEQQLLHQDDPRGHPQEHDDREGEREIAAAARRHQLLVRRDGVIS